jgi:hypothetical protein
VVSSSTNGFDFTLTGGHAVASKQAGLDNGSVFVTTYFQVVGDFTATVQGSRPNLAPNTEAGLVVGATNGYADIFFYGDSGIYANLFIGPASGYRLSSETSPAASFRIVRGGNTLSLQYDTGGGFQTLHSGTGADLAGPMSIGVFLVNEFVNTSYHSAAFNNLEIVADAFIFPRQFVVSITSVSASAIALSWPSLANRHYQMEHRSPLAPNTWSDVGLQLAGTGGTMTVTNALTGLTQDYFRVREFP